MLVVRDFRNPYLALTGCGVKNLGWLTFDSEIDVFLNTSSSSHNDLDFTLEFPVSSFRTGGLISGSRDDSSATPLKSPSLSLSENVIFFNLGVFIFLVLLSSLSSKSCNFRAFNFLSDWFSLFDLFLVTLFKSFGVLNSISSSELCKVSVVIFLGLPTTLSFSSPDFDFLTFVGFLCFSSDSVCLRVLPLILITGKSSSEDRDQELDLVLAFVVFLLCLVTLPGYLSAKENWALLWKRSYIEDLTWVLVFYWIY